MRRQASRRLLQSYSRLARPLVADADNDCRWQALIVLGEFVPSDPEAVWPVVLRYGDHSDPDMRSGVATVLLEHLLEHHFVRYWPRVRRMVRQSPTRFGDTLERISAFGQARAHRREIRDVLTRREAE
jgi:hypothetical protein